MPSLAVWHLQPVTPKHCLHPFSEKNKTEDNTLLRLASFCESCGIFPRREHFAQDVGAPGGPPPYAGRAQPLCAGIPGRPGHTTLCHPGGAMGLWRVPAVLSLVGRVSSLLLVAGLFLYFLCAAKLEKKNLQF